MVRQARILTSCNALLARRERRVEDVGLTHAEAVVDPHARLHQVPPPLGL